MDRQVRVGVIGVGNMGAHHVRNYAEMDRTKLVAVADANTRISEIADTYNADYYNSFEEMLDKSALEAVSLAVPTDLHHKIGRTVLESGVHLLVEKPIAANLQEALDLAKTAEEKGLVLTVGHIERYNPVISKAKEFIDSGKLGKITSVISQRLGGFPQKQPDTDVILDLAIHDIDIINYLLNQKGEVLASHGSRTFHTKNIDSAEILMDYNGVAAFIQANWITPVKIRKLAITGALGYLEANYISQELTHYERTNIEAKDDFSAFVSTFGKPNKRILKSNVEEPLRIQLNSFISAVNGEHPEALVSPSEAITALDLAISALSKMRRNNNG